MIRRFIMALVALLLACPASLAGEAANYEISSYVLYMTVQPDGDVRVREEIIYSNPSAYGGLTLNVGLEGTSGIAQVEVWADGQPLEALPAGERAGETEGFAVTASPERAVIEIHAPGDNDWRTFACAYTLEDMAKRYEDTALLERMLIPEGREVLFQNATVIVELPRSDGEVLAYVDGAPEEIPLIVQYDMVSIGPLDVAAGESLSAQILFPAEWLAEAETTPRAMRDSIVKPREERLAENERETNARRAEQYAATAAYVVLFGAALALLVKKYGLKGRMKDMPDAALLGRYGAALTGYAVADETTPSMAAGTLAELAAAGVIAAERDDSGGLTLRLLARPEGLSAHQQAVLDWLFAGSGERDMASLQASDYERAQAVEKGYAAYSKAVADDMRRDGLAWNNDMVLTIVGLLNILCGVILGMTLLLVGKRMLLEACFVALFMFFVTKQLDRVRHLTDEGERLQRAAREFGSMAERGQAELLEHLPVTVALGGAARVTSEEGRLWQDVTAAICQAHIHNASMRRRKA